ncbi:MAG: hypothetical protein SH821_03190 [Phototrophicales bacterium]|nr:hypothetical protein [Phototrophicales bacterium]
METLTLDQIKSLAQQMQSPSISIFLPTHRAGQDTLQDPIRFKNLLKEAEKSLVARGMGPREVEALLQPAQTLLDDGLFWQHQRDGLAVFIAPDDFHYYHLPFSVEELAVVAQSYYVKPILPLFTNNGHYYVLAISQDEVRLFEGTRHTIGQIDLPEDTPNSLDEALQFDDPEKQLQMHSGGSSTPHAGGRAGMFHGQGPGGEEQKDRLERYLNLLDASLKTFLDKEKAPLVLACVDYLLPIYHKVSDYAHIMKEGITGSPEHLRPEELQEQAWQIVEPYFGQEMETAIGQYHQFVSTDKATDNVREIIAAAFYGRVDKLFLVADTQMWGKFDPETGKVLQHQVGQTTEDDLELLDFTAMQTLQKDGHVYMLNQEEMPTDLPVAAVLRY